MTIFAQAGASTDTLTIWDRTITDFADGDTLTFTFPNEKIALKTGKNKNTVYVPNETGRNLDMILRLLIGSDDDLFLIGKEVLQDVDPSAFELASGRLTRRVGDGEGNVKFIIYELAGGAFTKSVDAISSSEGNIDSAVSIYNLRFATAERSVQ